MDGGGGEEGRRAQTKKKKKEMADGVCAALRTRRTIDDVWRRMAGGAAAIGDAMYRLRLPGNGHTLLPIRHTRNYNYLMYELVVVVYCAVCMYRYTVGMT